MTTEEYENEELDKFLKLDRKEQLQILAKSNIYNFLLTQDELPVRGSVQISSYWVPTLDGGCLEKNKNMSWAYKIPPAFGKWEYSWKQRYLKNKKNPSPMLYIGFPKGKKTPMWTNDPDYDPRLYGPSVKL